MGATKKAKMRRGKVSGKPANPDATVVKIEPVGRSLHGTKHFGHNALIEAAIVATAFNRRKRNVKPLPIKV